MNFSIQKSLFLKTLHEIIYETVTKYGRNAIHVFQRNYANHELLEQANSDI